ncbi:MAG: transglutaminase domain-containing protein [bacterium]
MRKEKFIYVVLVILTFSLFFGIYLAFTGVDNRVTEEDIRYIKKILDTEKIEKFDGSQSFQQELEFISSVQKKILKKIPHAGGLARNQTREPKDIYHQQRGSCFDRSRLLEKIFRARGLQTIHLAVYYTDRRSAPLALITPGSPSHAVSEVLTKKGWIIVDSNHRWLSVTNQGKTISTSRLQDLHESGAINDITWHHNHAPDTGSGLLQKPFVAVRGLYSRHGQFYPPYDRIPDINWREIFCNTRILCYGYQ